MSIFRSIAGACTRMFSFCGSGSFSVAVMLFAVLGFSLWTDKALPQAVPQGIVEEIEGELEILHEDGEHGSRYHYFLKTREGQRLTLIFFEKEPPTHVTSGARVRVRGERANNFLALQSGGGSVQVVAAAAPSTLGERRTLVVLVNFRNDTSQPYTVNYASDKFFNTTSNFFLENSYQQTYLSGVVKGWYTIDMDKPINAATCNTNLIASLAEQAAINEGVNLASYDHKVYAFPQTGCGWWGLSSVGGNPSQGWINGNFDLGATAHEFGHGLGLWHSHSLDCGTDAVVGTNCATNEYGDIVDMMGASQSAHFNAFQKERLGWLNAGASPTIRTVTSDGTYGLDAYESVSLGPKALKILKSTDPISGAKTWYYVESRKAAGFDAFLGNESSQNISNGLLIHTGTDGLGDSSHLLDMTPATPVYYWWYDPALSAGQTFIDPTSGLMITANTVNGSGASVTVRFGVVITVSTDRSSYNRNQTVSISTTVKSNGVPVAKAPVSFSIKKSNATVVTGSVMTGTDGIAVYKLRLTKSDPLGVYEVTATASTASAMTSFAVKQ